MPSHPWPAFFAPRTLAKGRAYAEAGRVRALDGDRDRLTARVQGDGAGSYRVVVELSEAALGGASGLGVAMLDATCTCPVGFDCKHAAAVLYAWCRREGLRVPEPGDALVEEARGAIDAELLGLDDEPTEGEDGDGDADPVPPAPDADPAPELAPAPALAGQRAVAIGRWLAGLGRLAPAAGEHRLTWHLVEENGAWLVRAVSARRLKSGAWGVLKRHEQVARLATDPPPYATGDDLLLARRLAALQVGEDGWHAAPALRRESGATGDLLATLLASGRCYLGSFATPAAAGAPRRAGAAWQEEADGWRLLLRDAAGAALRIIPVDPPWYVDGAVLGPLHCDLPAAVAAAALRMPALPAALLPTALGELRRAAPDLPLPPMPPAPAAPLPVLTCWRARMQALPQRWPPQLRVVEAALVHLRYGDVLVAPNGPLLVQDAAGHPVARDLAAEQLRLRQLAELGLVPIQNQGRVMIAGHHPRGLVVVSPAAIDGDGRLPPGILAALAGAGWAVEGSAGGPPATIEAATIAARWEEGDGGWFQLHLGVAVGDQRLDLTPLIVRLLEEGEAGLAGLPRLGAEGREWACLGLPDGRVVRLPLDLLRRLVAHLLELHSGGALRADSWQAAALGEVEGLDLDAPRRLRELAARLAALGRPGEADPPAGLLATLRPYQRAGLAWMQGLAAAGAGGVLADDMGLGKTVQAIAHLCAEHAAGRADRPSLVVCPASVVGTWRRELARFAPHLAVAVLHGGERERDAAVLAGHAVLVTSYGTCLRDRDLLAALPLHLLICDEAQVLKNASAKTGAAVRALDARQRLCLSGTPVENHLGELHALLHWLVPGLLGSARRFERAFRTPIEREGDQARAALLRRRIAPFVLRRSKEAVAPELPPRSEAVVAVELEGAQRALYESVRLAMDERIRAVLAEKGLARGRIEVLDALLKLRQCCCDPRLVRLPSAAATDGGGSAKLAWLAETLPELVEEGRRILVFSQFTSLLDLIETDVLAPAGLDFLRLDGSTTGRDALVQRFQAGEAPVFLLSLKAGGTGLTLTAADTVILCDPWWNPAAEAQAADRAHRIGQDKPVFVWRLVAAGTVEERILELQARKRALLEAVVDADGQAVPSFAEEDLAELLAPLPE